MRNKVLLGIGIAIFGYYLNKQYKANIERVLNRFPDANTKLRKINEFNKGVK